MKPTTVRAIVVCCLVVAALVGVVIFLSLPLRQPAAEFRISVLSATNEPDGSAVARIGLTNESASPLVYFPGAVQTRSNGVWSPPPIDPRGAGPGPIPGHEQVIIEVAVPPVGDAWRVQIAWGREPSGWERVKAVVQRNWWVNGYRLSRGRTPRFDSYPLVWMPWTNSPEVVR